MPYIANPPNRIGPQARLRYPALTCLVFGCMLTSAAEHPLWLIIGVIVFLGVVAALPTMLHNRRAQGDAFSRNH